MGVRVWVCGVITYLIQAHKHILNIITALFVVISAVICGEKVFQGVFFDLIFK